MKFCLTRCIVRRTLRSLASNPKFIPDTAGRPLPGGLFFLIPGSPDGHIERFLPLFDELRIVLFDDSRTVP
jgi:hypothetical protein